jgi:hypothetical protein
MKNDLGGIRGRFDSRRSIAESDLLLYIPIGDKIGYNNHMLKDIYYELTYW